MTIFCVGGVSGSGKSTLIKQHYTLAHLPCWDISDYYRTAEYEDRRISRQDAFNFMLDDVDDYLQDNPHDNIVLEAFFRPGSEQREMILHFADCLNQLVLFLWCHASRQQCYERVCAQWTLGDTEQRRQARLRFIREVNGRWFCGVRGEDPEAVLNAYEMGCYD